MVRAWGLPETWKPPHHLEVAVVVVAGEELEITRQRLTFWPFTHGTLTEDLQAVGLVPATSSYSADVDRYLVTARRPMPA
ncbi:MAG TPA: hypothetical protein VHF25_06890 [Nitriliruptorales bacterium]|nr:hypothetical protein [Nitriliruptorales bacterium]